MGYTTTREHGHLDLHERLAWLDMSIMLALQSGDRRRLVDWDRERRSLRRLLDFAPRPQRVA